MAPVSIKANNSLSPYFVIILGSSPLSGVNCKEPTYLVSPGTAASAPTAGSLGSFPHPVDLPGPVVPVGVVVDSLLKWSPPQNRHG